MDTFPPLKTALIINDAICWIVQSICKLIVWIIQIAFSIVYLLVKQIFLSFSRLILSTFGWNLADIGGARYKRINSSKAIEHSEPIPYRNQLVKRSLTYHGGLILGALLFLFVYYVLVKHQTFTSIAIGALLMLAYMVVLENSHNIRSILMLCLPIMFTNRGRALVFCFMLAIMVSGPMRNSQVNIEQIHKSLTCCKQYLIIKTDKLVEKNVVQNIVKVEDVIYGLVDNIKQFAKELRKKFETIINLALSVDRYIMQTIEELKRIIDVCNAHTQDTFRNCEKTFNDAYSDCLVKLDFGLTGLCSIARELKVICSVVKLPDVLCKIPAAIVQYIDETVGRRLRAYLQIIENEFYVDIDIQHSYSYNGTKSKSFKKVATEIKFDVDRKFWYIHWVTRVFNLVSLILVIWILITATLYHMHFLDDLKYDNMYLDGYLDEIEKQRKLESSAKSNNRVAKDDVEDDGEDENENEGDDKVALVKQKSIESATSVVEEDEFEYDPEFDKQIKQSKFLFPLTAAHKKEYMKPFSLAMNDSEISKLQVASFVWFIIMGYIFFFVLLDFALYKLIELIDDILRDVLFKSDLPLVDIYSKSGDEVIHYNRTYLNQMRVKNLAFRNELKDRMARKGSLTEMYRRLMDSIEANIPDDVAILDSLEQCLPQPIQPNYTVYKRLAYLALFTFMAVIMEAYALRTRHCIANLYYPKRARKRAIWLYRKMLAEKPKYEGDPAKIAEQNQTKTDALLDAGIKMLAKQIKR